MAVNSTEGASTMLSESFPISPVDLPLVTRVGMLAVLAVSAFYGVSYNTVLMMTIGYFKKLQSPMNKLLFFMAAVDVFNSLVVVLLIAYRLLGIVQHMHLYSVCLAMAAGVLFTNFANMLIITSMAIVRHQIVCIKKMSSTALHVSMVVILLLSIVISAYYVKQGGILAHVCVDPYRSDIPLGKNRLFYILALPFFASVGISVFVYYRIHVITRSRFTASSSPGPPSLLKPMMLVFGVYIMSFFPMLLLAVLRKSFGMGIRMAEAHLWVTVFSCFGYAVGSSAYSLHSLKLRRAMRQLFGQSSVHPTN